MKSVILCLGLLSCLPLHASAAAPAVESCEQLRAQIGRMPPADHQLLAKMRSSRGCEFTTAEIFRVAYGDKPVPQVVPHYRKHREHHDD